MIALHENSIVLIRTHQAVSGAYVASPTFSQYGYSWLRDGAWIAYAMDCAGERDSAEAFHRWAIATIERQAQVVDALLAKLARGVTPDDSDFLPTRFALDGVPGEEEWPNFQLDGYGAWLWSLAAYVQSADNPLWQRAEAAITVLVRYLSAVWQSPNYDCWEENRHYIHTATLAAIYGGLSAVQHLDPHLVDADVVIAIRAFVLNNCVAPDGHFVKSIGNTSVDSSLLWTALPFNLVTINDPVFAATLAKIECDLISPGGGVYRYKADTYYGGGEWLLLTAWMGWAYAEMGRTGDAQRCLEWVAAHAVAGGELPEQVSDYLLDDAQYQPWVERWGISACPLLWSHAMYLILETKL